MSQPLRILLGLSPLIVGIIVGAINSEVVNTASEKFELWFRKNQSSVSKKKNWFSRYIINPVLFVIVKFSDWTDDFQHRGVKNGTRVTVTVYLIAFWIGILYALLTLAIKLVIMGAIIYVLIRLFFSSADNSSVDYESNSRVIGPAGNGQRINRETGVIEKEGLLGWNNTGTRVNPETGEIQKEGFINWNDTGTSINQETGIIQEEGLLAKKDTGMRINPETGIIQKYGLLGWVDTDERIDPKSGKRQKDGFLGWKDT